MERIYLDANATTPLDPGVAEEMGRWLGCGNASSAHTEGRAARAAIDEARDRVAALIGAQPREIFFASGATEANALALLGSTKANATKKVFCSAVEHPSVLRTLEALDVELLVGAVDAQGRLPADIAIDDDTGLVSVMLANNETGAVQPVAEIAARVKGLTHTDAVQACGKMHVDVNDLGIDMLSLSAHKMAGPKGAGALYVRRGTPIAPMFRGGEHERGLRPGTENVAAIVGLGAAARLAVGALEQRRASWSRLFDRFVDGVRDNIPQARINTPRERIPNTISVTLPGVEGEAVLLALDLEGIAIATGSACSTGAMEPSHVLLALGMSRKEAEQSVRVSMHAATSENDVDTCVGALERAVKKLRVLRA